jgi:hypothetical protein
MTGATYGVVFLSEPTLVSGSTDNIIDSQDVIIVNELIGKKFSSISSHFNGVIASCSDGLYVISSSLVVSESSTDYAQVAGGKTFHVGIDSKTKALYSWGIGDSGQLGQGACRTALSEPTQVKYEAKFASVACGDQFCIATDEKGNAYGWGENFDRQLALYNKPLSAMCLKNAVIEDLVFSPRLVPFSMLSTINKVACGPNFAVAVTKVCFVKQYIFSLLIFITEWIRLLLGSWRVWSIGDRPVYQTGNTSQGLSDSKGHE